MSRLDVGAQETKDEEEKIGSIENTRGHRV
jgi:hypothetical protein